MRPGTPSYRIRVLGCRVNHAEGRELASVLERRGLVRADEGDDADLEVIHTCSVTGRAAAKSRQAIRRASRGRHRGAILVTGCLIGTDPKDTASLVQDRGTTFGHGDDLMDSVDRWVGHWLDHTEPTPAGDRTTRPEDGVVPLSLATLPEAPSAHVRAEVRIQDGCDAHCTFCIIPTTRPVLRSKPIATVLDETRRLVELGHTEVVLAGIFLGAYGHETALRRRQRRPHADPLADLVDAVAQVPGLARLRLSSLEPGDVTEPLLDAMLANHSVVTPHLHLPLQSGSTRILRRMNRQYTAKDYVDLINQVEGALTTDDGLPPAITTDIICGFPGETSTDFQATVDMVRRVGYLHMHVFPYSPRHGTAAARWTDLAVTPSVTADRVRHLIDLESGDDGLARTYMNRLLGRELRLIAEHPDPDRPGRWMGRCDHYARVSVEECARRGQVLRALGTGIEDDVMMAQHVPSSHPLPVLTTTR